MSSAEVYVGAFCVPPGTPAQASAGSGRYESMPAWGQRRWEGAETDRLNEAHWQWAQDESLNAWLSAHLATLRGRSTYEVKNNAMLLGMIATHAEDIVGPDGPTLQVLSDDEAYNEALEDAWQSWWYAPTHRPNMSGTALLKLWVRSLWKQGAFLAQLFTDETADGPIKLRLRPIHTRRLGTPAEYSGSPRTFMGVEYNQIGRPLRYWIQRQEAIGTGYVNVSAYDGIPAESIIHEYLAEEEDQGSGVPWLAPSLQPSADLRDYDDQVQDAARQMTDNSALLYTVHPDAQVWTQPEEMTVQRRSVRMAPPGWQPWQYQGNSPPVQYPDYRGERMREFGRPVGMPLMLIRLDSSKHNYSSARFDSQVYDRACEGLQAWISGTERSYGTLNRLVDEVAKEARFSLPALRRRPPKVSYEWTWPKRPHVDPAKERTAEQVALQTGTTTLIDVLAANGTTLETHVQKVARVNAAYEAAGLDAPDFGKPAPAPAKPDGEDEAVPKEEAPANA